MSAIKKNIVLLLWLACLLGKPLLSFSQEQEEEKKDNIHGIALETGRSNEFYGHFLSLSYAYWKAKNNFSGGVKFQPIQYKRGFYDYAFQANGLGNRLGVRASYKRFFREKDKKLNFYIFYTTQFTAYKLDYAYCSNLVYDSSFQRTICNNASTDIKEIDYGKEWVWDHSVGLGGILLLFDTAYLHIGMGYMDSIKRRTFDDPNLEPETYYPSRFYYDFGLSYYF